MHTFSFLDETYEMMQKAKMVETRVLDISETRDMIFDSTGSRGRYYERGSSGPSGGQQRPYNSRDPRREYQQRSSDMLCIGEDHNEDEYEESSDGDNRVMAIGDDRYRNVSQQQVIIPESKVCR